MTSGNLEGHFSCMKRFNTYFYEKALLATMCLDVDWKA